MRHIEGQIAAAKRSKPIEVRSLSTADTDTEYYTPPYPTLDGNTLTVPVGGMADKVRDARWGGAEIRINGARYSVTEFYEEGRFLVDKIAEDLPTSEWHPTIGQPEAANSVESIGHVHGVEFVCVPANDNYTTLRTILDAAFNHAAVGKGKERHARGLPFDEQPMMQTTRLVGPGFPLGQAIKKAGEAAGMIERAELDAAEAECLGAINYLSGAVAWMREVKEGMAAA
jgi:hypothetical protein